MMTPRPVALITGAARRVGRVIAHRLHAVGYDLVLHYRHSSEAMASLQRELEGLRPQSTETICAELAELDRLPQIIKAAIQRFGRLDALINNASAFYPTPVGTVTSAQWNELFASNAQAPFFLAQAAAESLKLAQGCIVNIVDIYAERPLPQHPVYCMAKAALAMMTYALAKELAPEVRVNGVAPGAVLWPESGKAYTDQQELVTRTPLGRAGTPEDVADAVVYLVHNAKFVTGQILRVDGGRSLVI